MATELKNRHAQELKNAGINVRKGGISNILEELVVQPLLVSLSALTLATETVRSILKIDDVVSSICIRLCLSSFSTRTRLVALSFAVFQSIIIV